MSRLKTSLLTWIVLCGIFIISGCSQKSSIALPVVEKVEVARYMGRWIEIARYENRFEKGCLGATADYSIKKDTIDVLNQCYDDKATLINQAHGHAYATDASNAKLRVSFFWPFYGDYQIIMLADDYRFSVVGEPSRNYLWILSRTQELAEKDKQWILQKLPAFGYDATKLYWTPIRP